MQGEIVNLLKDESARKQLASHGVDTVRQRHTCAHRARQFVEICEELAR
jgi:spore maturation protein CgeB